MLICTYPGCTYRASEETIEAAFEVQPGPNCGHAWSDLVDESDTLLRAARAAYWLAFDAEVDELLARDPWRRQSAG